MVHAHAHEDGQFNKVRDGIAETCKDKGISILDVFKDVPPAYSVLIL